MIILKRVETFEELLSTRSTWRLATSTARSKFALCHCPGCDQLWSLERWTIAADGTVTPSVNHSRLKVADGALQDCTFHDMVKLDGWIA